MWIIPSASPQSRYMWYASQKNLEPGYSLVSHNPRRCLPFSKSEWPPPVPIPATTIKQACRVRTHSLLLYKFHTTLPDVGGPLKIRACSAIKSESQLLPSPEDTQKEGRACQVALCLFSNHRCTCQTRRRTTHFCSVTEGGELLSTVCYVRHGSTRELVYSVI